MLGGAEGGRVIEPLGPLWGLLCGNPRGQGTPERPPIHPPFHRGTPGKKSNKGWLGRHPLCKGWLQGCTPYVLEVVRPTQPV